MGIDEITQKRAILFSARMQFAPEVQPVKETAIDKIVEQNLLLADCTKGVTLQEMEKQGALCFSGEVPAISHLDTENSLKRLAESGRLVAHGERGQEKYRLSEPVLNELWETQRLTEGRFTRVVGRLFRNAGESPTAYSVPFLECLCLVFSRLSETYVRLIKGEIETDELLSLPSRPDTFTRRQRHSLPVH